MGEPGTWTVIYDGQCRFCTANASRLVRWFPRGRVELVDYNLPGALAPFPALTPEMCAAAIHVVDPAGRMYRGAEAVARAIAVRGALWRWALLYYVPGVRWLCDRVYALIAANRYRIAGRHDACATGACRRPGAPER